MDQPPARMAGADVGREVLAHAERDPLARAAPPAPRRRGRAGAGPSSQTTSTWGSSLPEGPQGAQHRERRAQAEHARIGGQADEVDVVGDAVVGAWQLRVELAEQDRVLGRSGHARDEHDQRPVCVDAVARRACTSCPRRRRPSAGAPRSRARGRRTRCAKARSGGPKRTQPNRKPKPQAMCMAPKTAGARPRPPAWRRSRPRCRPARSPPSRLPRRSRTRARRPCGRGAGRRRAAGSRPPATAPGWARAGASGACSPGGRRRSWPGRRRSASTGAPSAFRLSRGMYWAPISGRHRMRPPLPRMRAASSESWSLCQSSSQPPCASSTARGQTPVKPLSTSISPVGGVAELGAAAAERRVERQRHPARPGAGAAGELRAADVVGAAAAQARDPAREVVLGIERVRVHARDVAPRARRRARC